MVIDGEVLSMDTSIIHRDIEILKNLSTKARPLLLKESGVD